MSAESTSSRHMRVGQSQEDQFGSLSYRPEIDGLRGVAVALVVLFHAGVPFMKGGFVGVDVFFVISGYLITRLICREVEQGSFAWRRFYERRVRRLLPAYAVMMSAVVLVGLLISLPSDLVDLGQSMVASSFMATNVLFWREIGYFAGPAEVKPLLHTWSLSVEEQYYLIFPLLVVGLWKWARSSIGLIIGLICLASLGFSEFLTDAFPSAAFYLLPARAWELGLGAMIAFSGEKRFGLVTRTGSELLFAIGVALLLGSLLVVDSDSSFPGMSALPACVGSALIILFARKSRLGLLILASKPLVFLGAISYSLYLWHWPVFAYLLYWNIDRPTKLQLVCAVCASMVLAILSWRYVERPWRSSAETPKFRALPSLFLFSVLCLAGGLSFIGTLGVPSRFSEKTLALARAGEIVLRVECMSDGRRVVSPKDACLFSKGGANPTLAIWGDSHAQVLSEPFADWLTARGGAIKFFGYSGCPPVPGVSRRGAGAGKDCASWNAQVETEIIESKDISVVLVAARHSAYVLDPLVDSRPAERAGRLPIHFDELSTQPDSEDARIAAYIDQWNSTIERVLRADKEIIIVLPVPGIGYDVPSALAISNVRGIDSRWIDLPVENYVRHQFKLRRAMNELSMRHGLAVIDPMLALCDQAACRVSDGVSPFYFDDNHLSADGVRLLLPQLEWSMKLGVNDAHREVGN